ncbi:MAG: hypothetical protein HC927_00555 [Deltaproteobacteria bacterium]|nr:hypothetical protein [Deltaproteobacteria bacterium]
MPENAVYWVDQSVMNSGNGSMGSPFELISEALALIPNGQAGTIKVKKAGTYEQVQIGQLKTVAILGVNAPVFESDFDTIVVAGGATVFVDGVIVSAGGSNGVSCINSAVWISDSEISLNGARGVLGNVCDMHVLRSRIVRNVQGALRAIDGEVVISNSFVGGDTNNQTAVIVEGAVDAEVIYSTLAMGYGTATVLSCVNGNGEGVSVRNSILVAATDGAEISGCDSAQFATTVTESGALGTMGVGSMDISWFFDFGVADFHLTANAPDEISTAATWQTGDPKTDIDGHARPTTDGTPDYAGADVPN